MNLQELATMQPPTAADTRSIDLSVDPLVKRQQAYMEDADRAQKVYGQYQENTNAAAQLESEILKGLKLGRPIADLFLLAMEAVAKLTHQTAGYEQAKADLTAVYAYALKEPGAVWLEEQAIQARLTRMQAAMDNPDVPSDSKGQIEKAIRAHRRALATIQN